MPRFFITEYGLEPENIAYITGEDAKHLKKSLRIKPGEELEVCDGRGSDYSAVVDALENDAVLIRIKEKLIGNNEPDVKVNLFTAITKGEGFEYAIRKCVEAGVHSITPLMTERTIVSIPDSKIDRRNERWNKIAEEAAKQSGRSLIPIVSYPVSLKAAFESVIPDDLSMICYVGEGTLSIKKLLSSNKSAGSINVFIGPEGGFSENEWKAALQHGIRSVTLGKRVLKGETAGFFAVVATMYEYGELDKK